MTIYTVINADVTCHDMHTLAETSLDETYPDGNNVEQVCDTSLWGSNPEDILINLEENTYHLS